MGRLADGGREGGRGEVRTLPRDDHDLPLSASQSRSTGGEPERSNFTPVAYFLISNGGGEEIISHPACMQSIREQVGGVANATTLYQ